MVEPLSLLKQYPSTLLGLQLTSLQQVLCCFVVPAIANCTIYIIDFASNVAVVYRHFQESNVRWAISTLLFMYVPSLVFFTLTVSNVDKWNEHFDQSNVLKWFFARLLYLVAFPILGIYRYAKIIFWSIDALFRQGNDREESLKNVTRPSHIELYLFLHAYLQGIPQAILQLSILYIEHNDNRETDSMQVLCIASSLMIVATTTVSFQRFESQKILGRLKPWANIPPRNDTATIEGKQQEDEVSKTIEPEEDESVKRDSDAEESTPYLQPRTIAANEIAEAINEAAISLSSENASEKFSERTPELLPRQSFIQYSENPYADPRTLIGNFPPQDSNFYEPQNLRPPSLPPPPPPPRTPRPIRKPLEFPTRKIPVKGLEQDELMGKSVSFLAWFFFLSGRVISLVSCFHFFPWLGFGISVFHYAVTLLVLHKSAKTISTVLLKLSLAFIYCFCLFEWKVIFKKVYLIYTIFFFTTTVENLVSSTAWYLLGDWEGWWYNYTYFLIWGCHVISIMCILMYFFILKPNSRMFYPEDSK